MSQSKPTNAPSLPAPFPSKKWDFRGRPSPSQMHAHIMHKKRTRAYFSITTIAQPEAPHQDLKTHQHMETRPCHPSGSRIHKLTCGHTVAVGRNAEFCAENCRVDMTTFPLPGPFKNPVPTVYAETLRKIRSTIADGFNAWVDALAEDGDTPAFRQTYLFMDVLEEVWQKQEKRLRPQPVISPGNFYCTWCSSDVQKRSAIPAFVLHDFPYCCIVVGKDDHDMLLINELNKGVRPKEGKSKEEWRKHRLGKANGRKVHEGRITKQRVEEKKSVISKLVTESLVEEWEAALTL